jgi:hypothetical protein
MDRLVLPDPILRPPRVPPLLSCQIQQRPGHLRCLLQEAELHVLRARLHGGILNKARRGELHGHLPVGFVYTPTAA